jgi:glycyl-tRNA synthetase beta chain
VRSRSWVRPMTDFLLELRSEEIPARMQVKAKDDLARLFAGEIAKAGLVATSIETFATPRRLALIARGLLDATEAVNEEIKGPKASAPPQALEGFLRKTGLTRDQLVERDGVLFALIEKSGQPTADVLAAAIPQLVRTFPWPKSMRWGTASTSTESLRWVRPLQGIVALFGSEIVPCEIDGIQSGRDTTGHRFMPFVPSEVEGPSADAEVSRLRSTRTVKVRSIDSYVEDLRSAHVLVHLSERTALIRDGAARLAAAAGLSVIEDEALVIENAGLTEWPVPLLGKFDPAFLDVPPEVIQLTARVNQKYFVLRDGEGRLAPNFICTANIEASDGGAAIVAGNERVLSARLADAKFFWEADLKIPLGEQAKKLSQIVFHEKLGTVAEKVERVAKLARWLCEEGIVSSPSPLRGEGRGEGESRPEPVPAWDATLPLTPTLSPEGAREKLAILATRAAQLCKADLVTGMVGEFPELQGVIGGYLAAAQGEHSAVAAAIRDHYKPVGQGDDVPIDPVTVAVSLADKLDTIANFFAIDEQPTGSRDPFALRRAALGSVSLIVTNHLRFDLGEAVNFALGQHFEEDRLLTEEMFGAASIEGMAEAAREGRVSPVGAAQSILAMPEKYAEEMHRISWTIFETETAITEFVRERLKIQQRESGARHDLIEAVFAVRDEDNICVDLARVKALQAFVGTAEGANLLAGYKRAANILKKENPNSPPSGRGDSPPGERGRGSDAEGAESPSCSPAGESPPPEGEELTLLTALDAAEPRAAAAIGAEDFEAAMFALASLRAPIDAFFEGVMVNDPDPAIRAFRLGLLARFRDAVHRVADFSKIEG